MSSHIPRLQKYKRNEIIEAINKIGLEPREFDLSEDNNEAWVKHKPSTAYFTIGGSPGHYVGKYVAGDWAAWPYDAYSWEAVLRRISSWLDEVKRDIEMPDLWSELQREAELLGSAYSNDTENTPFTSQEKKEIAERLNEFAQHAKHTYSLTETQMSKLNAKLDYLVKATERQGRIDWRSIFMGAIMELVLTAVLPPESVRKLILMLLRGIAHIYGFSQLPSN